MSRQVGSLNRSFSYPANLQSNLPLILLFSFTPPESPHENASSGMDSDINSNITVYNTVSQFNNSDLETPDEFDNSKTRPSTFSQPPFQPLYSQIRFEPPSTPSSISNVIPTCFPLASEPSDNNSSPAREEYLYEVRRIQHETSSSVDIAIRDRSAIWKKTHPSPGFWEAEARLQHMTSAAC